MVADAYEPVLSAVTDKGRYLTVDGAAHLDIVDRRETVEAIRAFVQ